MQQPFDSSSQQLYSAQPEYDVQAGFDAQQTYSFNAQHDYYAPTTGTVPVVSADLPLYQNVNSADTLSYADRSATIRNGFTMA